MKKKSYLKTFNFSKNLASVITIVTAVLVTSTTLKAQFGASPWVAPSGTYTVPANVTSIQVLAFGGGGGGGGAYPGACSSGGGGGGGAFSTSSFNSIVQGQTITVAVGAGGTGGSSNAVNGGTGGTSSVTYNGPGGGTCSAVGGTGGTSSNSGNFGNTLAGGPGGASGVGFLYAGGNGSTSYHGSWSGSGGGGGGAGNGGAGGNGATPAAGAAGAGGVPSYPGGVGAVGYCCSINNTNGRAGSAPGGGGSGGATGSCGSDPGYKGGAGGAGQVVIIYTTVTFSITSISPSSGCPGSTITINGVNLSGATAVTIGGVPVASITTNTATQITAVVGSSGTGVVAVTNSNGTTSSASNFTVNTVPAQPASIIGSASICANTANTYSVTPVSGATSYTWTLPGTWSGTSTTNSISVTPDNSGGTISVIASNACFSSTSQSLTISINLAPSMPGSISGSTPVCEASLQNYSIGSVSNATNYFWSFPGGWSGTSSSTSLSVTAGSTGGTISVIANNACGNSAAQTLAVVANPLPSQPASIIGNTSICGGTTQTYYVNAAANASSYTWTIPATWSGTSTGDSITVITGNTGGTISIVGNNSCGSGPIKTQSITTTVIPATPASVSGSTTLCPSTGATYSVTAVSGATSYTWTLPSGWTGTSTTNSISITSSTSGGTIFVTANNACGNSSAQSASVTVNNAAATPSSISGPATVCTGAVSYTVPFDANATSYTWTLPGGWSGTSVTDSVYATIGSGAGTISVVANSNCGSSSPQTLTVSLGNTLAQPSSILGVTHLCDSSSTAYAVTNDPNATSYTWTLPLGWSGTSTGNTITATADTTSGIISVTANNACGSSTASNLNVVGNTIPVVTLSSFGRVCDNISAFTLTGGSPAGGTYSGTGVNTNSFNPSTTADGTYYITYTVANGACVRSDSAAIIVDNCTGINAVSGDNFININPNPFTYETTIYFGEEQKHAIVKIVDMLGNEVKILTVYGSNNITVERGSLNAGVYFIQIIDSNKNEINRKIVIR